MINCIVGMLLTCPIVLIINLILRMSVTTADTAVDRAAGR